MRVTPVQRNSYRLLEVMVDMLQQAQGAARNDVYRNVHSLCCAFHVPTYHLMTKVGELRNGLKMFAERKYITRAVPREVLKTVKGFALYKKCVERNEWYRYAYEIYCVTKMLTNNFSRKIDYASQTPPTPAGSRKRRASDDFYDDGPRHKKILLDVPESGRASTPLACDTTDDDIDDGCEDDLLPDVDEFYLPGQLREMHARVARLVPEIFGTKADELLGTAIVPAVCNAYLILKGMGDSCVPFGYTTVKVPSSSPQIRNGYVGHASGGGPSLVDKIDWFLTGRHQPAVSFDKTLGGGWCGCPSTSVAVADRGPERDLSHRCVLLVYPESEAMLHVNIQVAHLRVLSKMRMVHFIAGKSLVFTVAKRKTIACSSYKTIPADAVLPTTNSLNFNIHGYDVTMMIALLTLDKSAAVCGFDELDPHVISHTRTSTHSLQNGLMDTNTYRPRVMANNPESCSKVPHFPAVKMTNLGLLHRETVLFNIKGAPRAGVRRIRRIIDSSAEMDKTLQSKLFDLETNIREMVDNHILGIFKVAYAYSKVAVVRRAMDERLICDRLQVGFNPKMTKSEFADKSKFDSESKGKASKKIKMQDATKNRKAFLETINGTFSDVSIDPANANSRGKWSFLDRINHSPDWCFYSKFMTNFLVTLRDRYASDIYPSFRRMLDMMLTQNRSATATM